MNKMFYKSLLGIVLLGNIFSAQTLKKKSKKEEIRYRYAYLEMNGTFEMDPKDSLTVNDSRNPSKIILSTTDKPGTLTKMTFFHHDDKTKKWAECGYQYIGSRPDPFYFPNTSKCEEFKYVISRSPHDSPLHMHLRYGDNVEDLLNMSKNPKDDKFNPWWAEYIYANKK